MKNNTAQKNIPQGWILKRLGDVLDYERPDNYIVKSTSYANDRKTPVLTANKSFILGYTDEDFGIYEKLPCVIFDDFTTDSKFVDFPFKVKSSAIKILKCKDENVDLKFVHEIMKLIDFPLGNHKRYYISQYQNILVPMPDSKKEQQKIAEILGSVDDEIEKTQEVIRATEKLKKGLMQELFTQGIGHNKFKKTKLGEIPEEWGIVLLGDKTNFIDYRGKTPKKVGSGIPLITAKNVRQGYVSKEPREYIAESDYSDWMTRGIPNKGDVLFTTEAPLGYVAQIETDKKIALAQRIITIQSNDFDLTFLKYLLMSQLIQNEIQALGTGGTVKGIKASILKKLEIILPEKSEQQEIAEILSAVDEKISINKKLKNKLTLLKKGLMQDILSGKVRVN